MKTEKIYAVEFMEYTNWEKICVSSNPGQTNANYFTTGKETCLVRESDLSIFQKYGNGFRSITFVGMLHVPEDAVVINVNDSDVNKYRIDKNKNLFNDNCMATDPILGAINLNDSDVPEAKFSTCENT